MSELYVGGMTSATILVSSELLLLVSPQRRGLPQAFVNDLQGPTHFLIHCLPFSENLMTLLPRLLSRSLRAYAGACLTASD